MKTRFVNILKLTVITTLFISSWSNVSAEVFEGYPDVIVCEAGKGKQSPGELAFYLESRGKTGNVHYRSSFHSLSIKIGKDKIVHADMESVNDCLNKSLEQLRKQGRTFNFTRQ